MAYKRDLSKPLALTFGDDKPKKRVKRKTKEAVVRQSKDAYYPLVEVEKKELQENKRKYTTGKKSRYGIDVGVKKTTKRKDGSVKKTKSTVSGTRYKNNNEVLTKSKVKYNKDGSVKKSKTTVKSLTGKTKTKTNQKGQTKTKNVAFKNRKDEGDKPFLLRGRTKAKRLTAQEDAKAKKKAAPKKRRVVTRTKS